MFLFWSASSRWIIASCLIASIPMAMLFTRMPHRGIATIRVCSDPFQVILPNTETSSHNEWPCYVRAPPGYLGPYEKKRALWEVPRKSLGELNTTQREYNMHVNDQKWALVGEDVVKLLENGGTSAYAFKDNFNYVEFVLRYIESECKNAGVMLDTGAGVGSVAAAMKDKRGGKGKTKVVGYVLPDEFLRVQAIMSLRMLPSFLHSFDGSVPFPDNSLYVVHCKWCWHHLGGYDIWLKEVERVLRPGGVFFFAFKGKNEWLLDRDDWKEAVWRRKKLNCERVHKFVLVCIKKGTSKCAEKAQGEGQTVKQLNKILRKRDGTFQRRLALECRTKCESLGRDVVHVGRKKRIVRQLLKAGIVGWVGSGEHVAVYPRSFDVVFVPCGWREWAEVHRVLRPGGVAVRFGCAGGQQAFQEETVGGGIVLYWREDV